MSLKEVRKLEDRAEKLKQEIYNHLNMVIGSINEIDAGHILTFKGDDGKTKTEYIREEDLKAMKNMSENHDKIKDYLKELSEVNKEILKLGGFSN
jgi:hypothetical protein